MVLFPINSVVESYFFSKMERSRTRTWLENLYRAMLVLLTIVAAILLGNSLDRFLSLIGALSCIPITFCLPALFHLKLAAKTKL